MSQFQIGGNPYPTKNSGGKLGEIESGIIRWYSNVSTGNSLTALNGSVSVANTFTVSAPNRFVEVVNFQLFALFIDTSTATYNVSDKAFISFSFPRFSNISTAYLSNNSKPINLLLDLDSSNQITWTVSINGGDVLRETGITPGAGDTVSIYTSIALKV